jgi:hypothetical protein
MTQFAVGQKVKIKEGGWGFHPAHVGKIVTIHGVTAGGRYTTEEGLSDPHIMTTHTARQTSVDGRSFEAVADDSNADKIRAINVLIKAEDQRIADAQATIDNAKAVKGRLNGQRQVLVACLLKEFDV